MSDNLKKKQNVSLKVSTAAKHKEQRTDDIIDADKTYKTLSYSTMDVAGKSLFYRTAACRPANEDMIRGCC
ncbi:hypothetical protein F1737_08920 [Methanoplanus sp. FWC-SCC4]|uniref:Uncharacterized protein n=1 Tax=Methanochimaera problematica TaxID=2609417 RepID=A0AA97I4W4_9EURY|nr:hypothetical protein [Methanoplanus sp. FWC-SCC4]WOF16801.1 hypothetical protein F1737_08920 [Methanoplanus sp. FWC-SCC4]